MFNANNKPAYVGNDKIIFLNRGLNIRIKGSAAKKFFEKLEVENYGVQPGNYKGLVPIPAITVNVGDKVKAGDLLFYDKKQPGLKFVSPVSGTVKSIVRGDRRSIKELVVTADQNIEYKKFNTPDPEKCTREELVEFLMECGIWPLIRQRPYNLIPDKNIVPKNIFISTFDTAPLAPDYNFIIEGKKDAFQKGLDVLTRLTSGNIHLGLNANNDNKPSDIFTEATGVIKTYFKGPHPSGNVGVHIHHTDPIKSHDKVWVLGIQEVVTLGNMFLKGIYDAERIISVTGEEVLGTKYLKTYLGAEISGMIRSCIKNEKCRVISGNVLHGQIKEYGEFLNAFDYQVTVVTVGDYYEPFGWIVPQKSRPTFSKTFLSRWLSPNKKYNVDTNTHGQERAFVASGIYEQVLPMDIYPVFLMKAILAGDIERMEGLGINELSEEDVALCEFICPSKQEFQEILREGHELMIEQGY
ncbi:MAG: Na(+)-translocating NADH-quinone reductase subunit A [Deltaproteobacteria bacterium]